MRIPAIIFLHLIALSIPALIQSQNDALYYDRCAPFVCGGIDFSFPFSSSLTFGSAPKDCGLPGYQIICDGLSQVPKLTLSDRLYRVKALFPSNSERLITVVDTDLIRDLDTGSCASLRNLTISGIFNSSLRLPPEWNATLTFFRCKSDEVVLPQDFLDKVVLNYSCNEGDQLYLWRTGNQEDPPGLDSPPLTPLGCSLVMVPVASRSHVFFNFSGGDGKKELTGAVLADGFSLQWDNFTECEDCKSMAAGGRCGYDGVGVVCFCRDGCIKKKKSTRQELIIGVTTGSCVFMAIGVLLLFFKRKSLSLLNISCFENNQSTEDGQTAKEFIKTYRSTLLANYPYHDIKKMTNGFKDKIGEGGYGDVYKGKFPDGRLIAVKVLEKSARISHDFVNEVATIGRIHHVNVINLHGFCCDGSKQALVYEHMSNGSLADLLSNKEADPSLGMKRLIEIAIGIAHGIEYLHNGCESRILHLDIKPQNVLLDQNLNPKISDFGMAKIYSRNRSAVTMTGARGTIGYIAPEIFMRNLGKPSHKSDVYSYGMLLLEMVGGKKHFEPETNSSRESSYFPGCIHEELTEEMNMVDLSSDCVVEVEEDVFIRRKMIMVGLWCIQVNPKDRPSISRVVEMLSGGVEEIEMPPKPFFFFPPHNNVTSIESDFSVIPLNSSYGDSLERH